MGWLLRLVTGGPLVGGPDKERKGLRGPRPEKVTGGPELLRYAPLIYCINFVHNILTFS